MQIVTGIENKLIIKYTTSVNKSSLMLKGNTLSSSTETNE